MRLALKSAILCSLVLACDVAASAAELEIRLEDCAKADSDGGPIDMSVCIANNNVAMKEYADRLADRALAYMNGRENVDDNELRSSEYLGKSQAAWWDYARSTCAVVAGQVGGAPQWVGREYDECLRKALERRIRFLNLLLGDGLGAFTSESGGEAI